MTTPSRRKYRDALVRLAHEATVGGVPTMPYFAARVSYADLIDRGPASRASLYRMWETQYDFWVDLARYLAFQHDFAQRESELPWCDVLDHPVPTGGRLSSGEFDKALADLVNPIQQMILTDTRILIRAASLGYADVSDVATVRRIVETTRVRSLADLFAQSTDGIGRMISPTYDSRDIAAACWSFGDGLSVIRHYVPSCTTTLSIDFGGGPQRWSLLALMVRALQYGCTSPIPPSGHGVRNETRDEITLPRLGWTYRQVEVLEAATQLFVERTHADTSSPERDASDRTTHVLSHLTVARLARYANVSRRTIYNLWSDRTELLTELLRLLLASQHATWSRLLSTSHRVGAATSLAPVTRRLIDIGGDRQVDPALAYLIEPHNPAYTTLLRRHHDDLIAALAQRLGAHLRARRRRTVSGMTTEHLAILWLCLVQGSQRLRRTGAHRTDQIGDLFDTIVAQLTVPIT